MEESWEEHVIRLLGKGPLLKDSLLQVEELYPSFSKMFQRSIELDSRLIIPFCL